MIAGESKRNDHFQAHRAPSVPAGHEDSRASLVSIIRMIEDRLEEARSKASAALSQALDGEKRAGVELLLDAEPALFEAQTLLQAAAILGRHSDSVTARASEA